MGVDENILEIIILLFCRSKYKMVKPRNENESPETLHDGESSQDCSQHASRQYREESSGDMEPSEEKRGRWSESADTEYDQQTSGFHVGQQLDVLDSENRWSEAEILKIDTEQRRIYITYLYWADSWNVWLNWGDISTRVAPLNTHTYYKGGPIKLGQRVEVLDTSNKWLEAFVVDEMNDQVKIHYFRYAYRYDEWIPRKSDRIRPFGRAKDLSRKVLGRQWQVPGQSSSSQSLPDRTRQISQHSDQYSHYLGALEAHSLRVVPVDGDGNCLFRSVAHQIYGDASLHSIVREKCMDYMESEANFYSQFIEGGMDFFHQYLSAKRLNGCWGDDPEIQAMCELYSRPAEIWAYDHTTGARKLRTFHEAMIAPRRVRPMRLSFYGGGHYDSIVDIYHGENTLKSFPGFVEDILIRSLASRSAVSVAAVGGAAVGDSRDSREIEVEEAKLLTDTEATDHATLELALQVSRQDVHLWSDDDLQTCLALSLTDTYGRSLSDSLDFGRERLIEHENHFYENKLDGRADDERENRRIEGHNCVQKSIAIESKPVDAKSMSHKQAKDEQKFYPKSYEQISSFNTFAEAKETKMQPRNDSLVQPSSDDMAAIQGQVMRSVAAESEREYLEKAIQDSLVSSQDEVISEWETITTEEVLLEQAKIASMKEAGIFREGADDGKLSIVGYGDSASIMNSNAENEAEHISHAGTSGEPRGYSALEGGDRVDPDIALVLKLSQLDEQEALELAMRQSLEASMSSSTSSMLSHGLMDEDDAVRIALVTSLADVPSTVENRTLLIGGTDGSGDASGNVALYDDDEYVRIAIEESYNQ